MPPGGVLQYSSDRTTVLKSGWVQRLATGAPPSLAVSTSAAACRLTLLVLSVRLFVVFVCSHTAGATHELAMYRICRSRANSRHGNDDRTWLVARHVVWLQRWLG